MGRPVGRVGSIQFDRLQEATDRILDVLKVASNEMAHAQRSAQVGENPRSLRRVGEEVQSLATGLDNRLQIVLGLRQVVAG